MRPRCGCPASEISVGVFCQGVFLYVHLRPVQVGDVGDLFYVSAGDHALLDGEPFGLDRICAGVAAHDPDHGEAEYGVQYPHQTPHRFGSLGRSFAGAGPDGSGIVPVLLSAHVVLIARRHGSLFFPHPPTGPPGGKSFCIRSGICEPLR